MHEEGAVIKNKLHYAFICSLSARSWCKVQKKLFLKWVTITSRSLLDWEKVGRDRRQVIPEGVCRALTQEQEKVRLRCSRKEMNDP